MNGTLTGTGGLVRFALRRDRLRLPLWILVGSVLLLSSASAQTALYPEQADRDAYAAAVGANPAIKAMAGPGYGLDSIGGIVVYEIGVSGLIIFALMSIFLVTRHTRAEEEQGRLELVRSTVVGRDAPLAAALIVVGGGVAVLAAIVTAGLLGIGLPVAGSVALGGSLLGVGLVFAGVAAVAAQITEHARSALGLSASVLGAAFLVRAAGDVGDGTLSWLSPLGWAFATRPYAGERWWPLLLSLGLAALSVAVAGALSARRDVGAGLVPTRPGRPRASAWLSTPIGLALRLHRGALVGWGVGLFVLGASIGSVGREIEDLLAQNDALAEIIGRSGVDLTDAYFTAAMAISAVVVGGFALQATLRMRSEETALRAEPVLAGAVSRWRWAGSHLVIALVGSVVVLGLTGLGVGLVHGLRADDPGEIGRLLGASLVYAPAVWVLVGLATAIFGLVPRAAAAAWVVLAGCAVVVYLGEALDLPSWLAGLSPFDHIPELPAAEMSLAPLVWLTGLALGLLAVGLAGFRRRDIG